MGRPKGSSNKNKSRLLRAIQSEFPKYDPLVELIRIAISEDSSTSERIACHKEVAQYVNPKLKAIEMDLSSEDGSMSPKEITIKLVQADEKK